MNTTTLAAAPIPSPIGTLLAVVSDRGLRELHFSDDVTVDGATRLDAAADHPVAAKVAEQLGEYFAGDRTTFDLPLDPVGTEFQLAVWGVLRTIPYGETMTYAEQADRLGDRNKARAVGAANGRNPIPIIVPCHRVVGADGSLTGFAGGLDTKRALLDLERGSTPLPL